MAQTSARTKWVIALAGAACLGVMVAVIAVAKGHAGSADEYGVDGALPPRETASGPTAAGGVIGEPWPPPPPAADAGAECGPLDPDKPPLIEFDLPQKGLDLGTLKQGVRIEREAGFRNAGTGPLCITRVTSGCGCLKATLVGDKKRYEPGETGRIKLKVDTTGRQGHVSKRVSVFTNEPGVPSRHFNVEMDIDAGLMLSPRYIDFGNQPPGASVTRDIFLMSPKDEPEWKVLAVQGGRRAFGADILQYTFEMTDVADPKYRKVRVSITHPGLETVGPFRDPLVVSTTHPERSRLVVQSSINVVPRIRCRSRIISMGFVRPGQARPPTRARIQAGVPGLEFRITGVEVVPLDGRAAPPGGTGFEASYGEDERGWYVDVKYDGRSRKPGLLDAELVVHTDDALQPDLRVRIRATVQEARH